MKFFPAREAMLMMHRPFWRIIVGRTPLQHKNTPRKFTFIIPSKSLAEVAATLEKIPNPALFTKMSTVPECHP